jgi:hypothetical protein
MTDNEARWIADVQAAPPPAAELLYNAASDPAFSPEALARANEAIRRAACGLGPLPVIL